MNVLFVVNKLFFSENLGVMILSSVCKDRGHKTKLLSITQHDCISVLNDFCPDVVAYSAMTSDIASFKTIDLVIGQWAERRGRKILRIMGGAHASVFPEIVDEMMLDAVVVGEGDRAIVGILKAFERNATFSGIPNVVQPGCSLEDCPRELIQDLDSIPFPDRDLFYDARPLLKHFGLRSVIVGRGCPYRCTYCHNDVFNRNFKGIGRIVRRRSVDNVMEELAMVCRLYGPVRQIRFGDDTFLFKLDSWSTEFLERYRKEISRPFYCLLRSNIVSEDLVSALAKAGCHSVSLSIESGDETIRNSLLKRGISDRSVEESFRLLRKYNINTQTNSMLALPGGCFDDDLRSYIFEKSMRPSIGQFSIWTPFPRTSLASYAKSLNCYGEEYSFDKSLSDISPLNSYTEKEKSQQLNMVQLGPLFINLPSFMDKLFYGLIKIRPNVIFRSFGILHLLFVYFHYMFKPAVPRNPVTLIRLFVDSVSYAMNFKRAVSMFKCSKIWND